MNHHRKPISPARVQATVAFQRPSAPPAEPPIVPSAPPAAPAPPASESGGLAQLERRMNPRFAATIQLQTPDRYRDPTSLIGQDVCSHCKRATVVHRFTARDGHWIETHHCPQHGDVAPMRSHVINP